MFSTLITAIGFLSGVSSLVGFKAHHFRKMLSTLITPEWFLSSMNSLVFFKVGCLREVLSTLITNIRFLSWENSLVFFKAGRLREILSTLITTIWFLSWFFWSMKWTIVILRKSLNSTCSLKKQCKKKKKSYPTINIVTKHHYVIYVELCNVRGEWHPCCILLYLFVVWMILDVLC